MDENTFLELADEMMAKLESAIETAADAADIDLDIEPKPGGILELEFESGSKIIINRHAAAREIWVAAKSGGYHYRYDAGRWVNTRDGEELTVAVSKRLSEQAGVPISLA